MRVTVDTATTSPKGLVLGGKIEYSDDGPIRFVTIVVPWVSFTTETRADLLAGFNRMRLDALESDSLYETLF